MRMRIGAGGLAFLVGFGLLPLWLVLIYVLIGSIGAGSDYMATAGWYVFFALPACLVTIVIAGITAATHALVHGAGASRRNASFGVFLILCAAAALGADQLWNRYEAKKRELRDEVGLARATVKDSGLVRQAVGAAFEIDQVSTIEGGPGALPLWYVFKVSGSQSRYVIVNVTRARRPPVLAVVCVAHREPSYANLANGFCPY